MYATLYDFFLDAFGISLPFLKIANSFGFFIAISFLLASYVMALELKRKETEGLVKGVKSKEIIGKPFPILDYIVSGFFGFLLGFKIIHIFFNSDVMSDPQGYLLSMNGSWFWGLVLAAMSVLWKLRENKKQVLPEPITKDVIIHPYQHMGNITMVALIAGLIGAKVFHNLENWNTFIQDPLGELVAFSGLTFYGGLICGGIGVLIYANKKGIKPLHMLDVGGPAMMLTYATGRMGCHIAGDGDWGIVNTAPKPGWMSWLPDWFWAYDYPNNVNNAGVPIEGCVKDHCYHLDPMVFPTPLYEILMAGVLFLILWKLRKKIQIPGVLFGLYLVMNGIERFLIEKIRVNTIVLEIGNIGITQAEIISSIFIIGGLIMMGVLWKNSKSTKSEILSLEEDGD